jgi:integrase
MYGVLFAVMLTTGLRPSEALGLKWDDLQGVTLRIQRSIEHNGNGWNFGSLKTPKARRSVSVPSSLLIRLKAHRIKQAKQKLSAGADYQDHGLIFATPEGQPLDLANIRQRHFKPILQKAGLPDIRMYDLRHTCATLLLAAGENVKVVSERLSHASVAMTLDNYAHVLPDMQQQATDKLEDMLYGN